MREEITITCCPRCRNTEVVESKRGKHWDFEIVYECLDCFLLFTWLEDLTP